MKRPQIRFFDSPKESSYYREHVKYGNGFLQKIKCSVGFHSWMEYGATYVCVGCKERFVPDPATTIRPER